MMHKEICIEEIVDNYKAEKDIELLGHTCKTLEQVMGNFALDVGIILCISQYQRKSAVEQLEQHGLSKNKDYFYIEDFLGVYFAYKYNKVFFSSISFLPSTRCNLNCKNCLNFNPYAKEYYVREYDSLIEDIDLFFSKVDYVMLFHISGGEPTLYPHLASLIRYIDNNYGDRIHNLRTVTNGTIIPNKDILQALKECRIRLTVDDYREAVPNCEKNFVKLLEILDDNDIEYVVNKVDTWVNLKPMETDYSMQDNDWLSRHFDDCCQTWQELREGKLYLCNYSSYAKVAGICEEDPDEYFDLKKESDKKELLEFRLGYSKKGYTDFCKRCRGFGNNTEYNLPAEQTER